MSVELEEKVREFFEMLGTKTKGIYSPINYPIQLSCGLPYPARENLNKVLADMKRLSNTKEEITYWEGNLVGVV